MASAPSPRLRAACGRGTGNKGAQGLPLLRCCPQPLLLLSPLHPTLLLPPDLFISKLLLAKRLECCFLNGCRTGELGHQICSKLPGLKVICWTSVAEDAAARSFALGFYDAVGAMISAGDTIQIELAFWAGLEHFTSDGFRLGDPAQYLHPPGHPHALRPVFSPPCKGCTPPVHGKVVLLRAAPGGEVGAVETLRLEPGGANGEAFCWDKVAQESLRPRPPQSASGQPDRSPSDLPPPAAPASPPPSGATIAEGQENEERGAGLETTRRPRLDVEQVAVDILPRVP